MRLRTPLAAVAAALLVSPTSAALAQPLALESAAAQGFRVPLYSTDIVDMPICRSEADLDCVEGVAVVRRGARIEARRVGEHWEYQPTPGELIPFRLYTQVIPLGYLHADPIAPHRASVYVEVTRLGDAAHPVQQLEDVDCSTGALEDCVLGAPPLPASDQFEISVRTSWLRPLMVNTQGIDSRTRWTELEKGHRFTFSAKQVLMPVTEPIVEWPPPDSWNHPQAWEARLYFIVDHAADRPGWSAYDTRCADKGFPNVSRNAVAAGRPEWVGESLDFNVMAPHNAPDGTTLHGLFEADLPLSWLRCRSGLRGLKPNALMVQVLSENGMEQAATTSLTSKKGMLKVRAYDFHYSSPTIKLARK